MLGTLLSYLFRNGEGAAVNMNDEGYRAMVTNQLNIKDLWFQQNTQLAIQARLTINLMQYQFEDNFISRSVVAHCPSLS